MNEHDQKQLTLRLYENSTITYRRKYLLGSLKMEDYSSWIAFARESLLALGFGYREVFKHLAIAEREVDRTFEARCRS